MWIFYAFLSSVLIAVSGFFDKLVLRTIKPLDSLFVKAAIMLVLITVVLVFTTKAKSLHAVAKPEIWYLLIAGVVSTAAWLTYNVALASGTLSIVSLIYRSSFILSILLGVALLGESLSTIKIIGVILSIGGLVLVSI